jgi:histidinol-phosphate aminotransferase
MPFPALDADLHRMHWNENPFDFPADLKEEVLQRVARSTWSRYPSALRGSLVAEAVAKATGLDSSQVVIGSGSTDLLRLVVSAILQPGDHLVTLAPTYRAYASYARQIGAAVHAIDLDPQQSFALPVNTILEAAAQRQAKLIALCAPNNPTGTIYPVDQLREIALSSEAIVLIDAAYAEFCGQDLRPLLDETYNVVVVHTLSKAFALAGVRVGYALSVASIAGELNKLVPVFTLSPFSESAAIVALENKQRFQPMVEAIVIERAHLAAELAKLPGVTIFSSGTNFLFVYLGQSGKDAQSYLRAEQRVLISDMGMYAGYEDYIRISVGTREENNLVLAGLAHYLATVAL